MARRRILLLLVTVAACLVGATGSDAQVQPLRPEFQVNVATSGEQFSPRAIAAPDGSFTVTWLCVWTCPSGAVLLGRRFDEQGVALGGELLLSQSPGNGPSDAGSDAAGNFVLTWGQGTPGPGGGSPDQVRGRRFTADAAPRGGEFLISEPPGDEYTGESTVAVHEDGGFVVAWNDYGLFARTFDADGLPVVAPFQIAGWTDYADQPSIAVEPDGGFLVIWNHYLSGVPAEWDIRGQRYDADGLPLGSELPIAPAVSLDGPDSLAVNPDSSFVVVWIEGGSPGDERVRARRFQEDGQPIGVEIQVNSYPSPYSVWNPAITRAADGVFLISWTEIGSPGSDTSGASVQGRRFGPDGTPLGNQFQINSLTTGDQRRPKIAIQPSGDFIVVWTSDVSAGNDDSATSIQARRFRVPFFFDGFESGDLSRWSASIP